ncbi:DUF4870 domain-containing protein [Kocuria massiliensis]|uniref:DUF4870 domain-containing protein n=1 Tax=Kocuria massiliensis TaxID=1926282 RepID=UPI00117AE856|nr:DUF4870 domain-containing protein [Kocuria massiliensis]
MTNQPPQNPSPNPEEGSGSGYRPESKQSSDSAYGQQPHQGPGPNHGPGPTHGPGPSHGPGPQQGPGPSYGPGPSHGPGAQQGPGGPSYGPGPAGPGPSYGPGSFDAYGNPIPSDARTLALFSHLSTVLAMVISLGSLSFLGPLIFWLIYKDKPGYQFVRTSSAEAFNFNAIIWIVNIAGIVITAVTFGLGAIIAVPVMIVVSIIALVCHIVGAVKANRGEIYRYPMKISILS